MSPKSGKSPTKETYWLQIGLHYRVMDQSGNEYVKHYGNVTIGMN
jgi:hypothetical protein